MDQVDLYRKNSFGVGTWHIWQDPVQGTRCQIFVGHCTVEGGSRVTHVEDIKINQSGRTLQEQVDLRMRSRIERQLNKGYKRTREEALAGPTNQLGLVTPMLAQKIGDVRLHDGLFAAHVQPKFDGHRCLVTKQDGEMLAYSRQGKPIVTIPHVLESFEPIMQDGDTFDGELYIHGLPLQTISSIVKRNQERSREICYHWYDVVDANLAFADRWKLLSDLHASVSNSQIHRVPTYEVSSAGEAWDFFEGFRREGYEGAMLRLSKGVVPGYATGRRSAQLLKMKERSDCEVTALSCRPSKEGWAVLTVQLDNGVTFDTSAPGDHDQKRHVFDHFDEQYRGRRLTIEYPNLTEDGIPFHAVAMRWHEEL